MTTDRIEIYRDLAGEYRWRRRASNWQIVSGPGEGYTRKWNAIKAAVARNRDVPADRWLDLTKTPTMRVRSVLLDGVGA